MANQPNSSNNSNTNPQDSIQSQIDHAAKQLTQTEADNPQNTPSSATLNSSFSAQHSNLSLNQSSPTSYFSKPDKPIIAPTPTLTDQELQHIQEKPQLKTHDKKPASSQVTVYVVAILLCICIISGIIFLVTLIL